MDEALPFSSTNPWLERLKSVLPEYHGYADPTSRAAQDEAYRRYLVGQLEGLLSPLGHVIDELARGGRVIEALPLERVRKRMYALTQALRAPDYGATAFFNARPAEEAALDLLYQYDLVLNEHVRALYAQLDQVRARPADLLAPAESLEATLLALEAEFKARCEVIRNWA